MRLMELGFAGEFEIYISTFSLVEIATHFRDWYLLQKLIKKGFSYKEFRREKKRFSLLPEEEKEIERIVTALREHKGVNFIKIDKMHEEFFNQVVKYVSMYMEFLDAIHLRVAIDVMCDMFLTKDGELRKRAQELISKGMITESIAISSVSGFLKQLKG